MKCAAEKDGVEEVSLKATGCCTAPTVQGLAELQKPKKLLETQ